MAANAVRHQSAAASPARVAFEVIENPTGPANLLSADAFEEADSFRPSEYYFRRDLRAAPTRERAVEIAQVVVSEGERLRMWLRENGLALPPEQTSTLRLVRELWVARTREEAIGVGLRIVANHEHFRAAISAMGVKPPKWIIAPAEAEEKRLIVCTR